MVSRGGWAGRKALEGRRRQVIYQVCPAPVTVPPLSVRSRWMCGGCSTSSNGTPWTKSYTRGFHWWEGRGCAQFGSTRLVGFIGTRPCHQHSTPSHMSPARDVGWCIPRPKKSQIGPFFRLFAPYFSLSPSHRPEWAESNDISTIVPALCVSGECGLSRHIKPSRVIRRQ
jgi:hypothetical protein